MGKLKKFSYTDSVFLSSGKKRIEWNIGYLIFSPNLSRSGNLSSAPRFLTREKNRREKKVKERSDIKFNQDLSSAPEFLVWKERKF